MRQLQVLALKFPPYHPAHSFLFHSSLGSTPWREAWAPASPHAQRHLFFYFTGMKWASTGSRLCFGGLQVPAVETALINEAKMNNLSKVKWWLNGKTRIWTCIWLQCPDYCQLKQIASYINCKSWEHKGRCLRAGPHDMQQGKSRWVLHESWWRSQRYWAGNQRQALKGNWGRNQRLPSKPTTMTVTHGMCLVAGTVQRIC